MSGFREGSWKLRDAVSASVPEGQSAPCQQQGPPGLGQQRPEPPPGSGGYFLDW